MKKYMPQIGLGLLIIAILVVGFLVYSNRSGYEVDLKLTPEETAKYTDVVQKMDAKIKEVKLPEKPDIDFFIEKARAQEYLGKYGEAIDTLLNAFTYYENTSVGWNNIAKLYDKVGDFKSAIVFYTKLIEVFTQNQYYINLAWDFYRLGDTPKALESYGRYVQFTGGTDQQLLKLLQSSQKNP